MIMIKSGREGKSSMRKKNRKQMAEMTEEEKQNELERLEKRLEHLLDERMKARSQPAGRQPEGRNHDKSLEDDGAFRAKLESIKQKRLAMEEYGRHLEKFSTICHIGTLRQPYLRSQHHIPPWLMCISERELSLPLVPTFPTSEAELKSLTSQLRLEPCDTDLLSEYITAASCIRRMRIGINLSNSKKYPSLSRDCLQNLYVFEETSNGHIKDDNGLMDDLENGTDLSLSTIHDNNTVLQINSHGPPTLAEKSLNRPITHANSLTTRAQRKEAFSRAVSNPRQLVEKVLQWDTLYCCPNAVVSECRDERVLVKGKFPSETSDELSFQLLLFPGERSGPASMMMKGTFIRDAGKSGFRLRWKYVVEIPAVDGVS